MEVSSDSGFLDFGDFTRMGLQVNGVCLQKPGVGQSMERAEGARSERR